MFETGVRQVKMALSMVWGRPISSRNIERLIEDALGTLATFGAPGDDVQQLLDGPWADPEARRDFQTRALRRTAKRLTRVSPFYADLFGPTGINPGGLTPEDMPRLPVTLKQDLITRQSEFLASDSKPFLSTRTTGTTGSPPRCGCPATRSSCGPRWPP